MADRPLGQCVIDLHQQRFILGGGNIAFVKRSLPAVRGAPLAAPDGSGV